MGKGAKGIDVIDWKSSSYPAKARVCVLGLELNSPTRSKLVQTITVIAEDRNIFAQTAKCTER